MAFQEKKLHLNPLLWTPFQVRTIITDWRNNIEKEKKLLTSGVQRAWADGWFPVYIAFEKLGLNLYVNNSAVFTSLFYLKLSLLVHIVLKFSSLSLTFILCQVFFFLSCMFMLFATVFFSLGWRPSAVWRRQNNHYLFSIAALHFQNKLSMPGQWLLESCRSSIPMHFIYF